MGVDPNYINVFFSHGKKPRISTAAAQIILRGSAKVTEPGSWPRRCHGNDGNDDVGLGSEVSRNGHVGVEHHGNMQLGDMQWEGGTVRDQPSNKAVAGKWIRIESMYFLLKMVDIPACYVLVYQRVHPTQCHFPF